MNIIRNIVFKYIKEWEDEKPVRDIKVLISSVDDKLSQLNQDLKDIGQDDPLAYHEIKKAKELLLTEKSDLYNQLVRLDNND
jgi:hypothetical protein